MCMSKGRTMYFPCWGTKGGAYSWWLYASNREQVAWAGETFASESNANGAATSFKAGAATALYEVYGDAGRKWRWRAWRSSDKGRLVRRVLLQQGRRRARLGQRPRPRRVRHPLSRPLASACTQRLIGPVHAP